MKIQILFTRNKSIGSRLIRWMTWSEFSHVEIIINKEECIGARMTTGVAKRRIEDAKNDSTHWEIYEAEGSKSVIYHLRQQLGKKYDIMGIFGFIFRSRRWQREDKWFCSELVAYCFEKAGFPLYKERPSKVSPRDLVASVFLTKVDSK